MTKKIGLLGTVVNNDNLGCVALTYSLFSILNSIDKENDFEYILFEMEPDSSKIKEMCQQIGLPNEKISSAKYGYFGSAISIAFHFHDNINFVKMIKNCSTIIDITEGDSFTDIYGNKRFLSWTRIKSIIERMNIPLILGPQTYGPFNSENNRKYALRVINNADYVFSRDAISTNFLHQFINKGIITCTDLAFALPYQKNPNSSDKIKVGINISGLLVQNKHESTHRKFSLVTDYDAYVDKVLEFLCSNNKYEVHLIPHVGSDCKPIEYYSQKYANTIIHGMFSNPITAKNTIASLDIFIGARMHATIAAFSSGVCVIPNAYSRKFKGVFDNYHYNHIIDLCTMDTEQAVKETIEKIKSYKKIKNDVNKEKEKINTDVLELKNIFIECFIKEGIL